jgi:hypothetical protein
MSSLAPQKNVQAPGKPFKPAESSGSGFLDRIRSLLNGTDLNPDPDDFF